MKFKKIKIRNIRSYKAQEIEFPEGSFLLSGDVGSGKTSILLALEYGLFGLQPGQKGSSLLRNDSQIGEVILEMEIAGRQIIIERKLKRTAKGVSNEYASISIDGEKEESSLTEIKSKIVNLLGYPQEFVKKNNILYRYTVYSPQEQMKQIILEDPESRLNVLRHVFGIDKYKQIKDNLSILLIHLRNNSKFMQFEISTLEQDKETLELRKQGLKTIRERVDSQGLEFKEKIKHREKCEQDLKSLQEKIEERRAFISEIEKTKILVLTKKENVFSLEKEIEDLSKSIKEEKVSFDEKDYSSLIQEISSTKKELENFIAEHSNLSANLASLKQESQETLQKKERIFKIEICPTCLQDVPEAHKHNILNETENKLSKIKSLLEELEKRKEEVLIKIEGNRRNLFHLEDKKTKLEILKSKLDYIQRSQARLQSLTLKKQTFESDIALLTKHMDNLKENSLKYTIFENHFKRSELELKQAVLEEKNTEIFLAELKKELEWLNKEILNLEKAILKKESSKKKLQELNELSDWLSSQFLKLIELVERNVLFKLRNEFSVLFRKWFLMLVPEGSLDMQIDESFTPIILQGGAEMDYSFLSGGERTAVALAYRLALNQTINSLLSKLSTRGIIILDEPTDGFSEAQIAKIRDILEELNAEQLIIVSHEQKIESFVDNVIRISKEGGISSFEV